MFKLKNLLIISGVALLVGCSSRPVSGENWNLDKTEVSSEFVPGSVEFENLGSEYTVSFVVESGSGGEEECDEPYISDINIRELNGESGPQGLTLTGNEIDIEVEWPQRGCVDMGGVSFTLNLENKLSNDPLYVKFSPSPDSGCVYAFLDSKLGAKKIDGCLLAQ